MANVKYFSGDIQLSHVFGLENKRFLAIGGEKSKANYYDSFARLVGISPDRAWLPVTRKITFKNNPSLHKCGSKCRHAKGGVCECECGGKYHGIGG